MIEKISRFLNWIQQNREWSALLALAVTILVGGTSYYFYVVEQQQSEALNQFRQVQQNYIQTQQSSDTDFSGVRSSLRNLGENYPNSSLADKAWFFYARTFYLEGDCQQALPEFDRLISEYPDSSFIPSARLYMGDCYDQLERYQQALSSYQAVLDGVEKDHPLWIQAALRKAELLYRRENYQQARTLVGRIVDNSDQFSPFWLDQARALQRNFPTESE